jgi:hypothetical protein
MGCEWIKLTSQDTGKAVFVNLINTSAIETHKKGALIWLVSGDKDVTLYVTETPDEILERSGAIARKKEL